MCQDVSHRVFDDTDRWYHGSNLLLDVLNEGSTITQWKELAEAFSHKPHVLCYDDVSILHTGREKGYLYVVDEPVRPGVDVYPHPRSTMDENIEFLTRRPLRLRLVEETGEPTAEQLLCMRKELSRMIEDHGGGELT